MWVWCCIGGCGSMGVGVSGISSPIFKKHVLKPYTLTYTHTGTHIHTHIHTQTPHKRAHTHTNTRRNSCTQWLKAWTPNPALTRSTVCWTWTRCVCAVCVCVCVRVCVWDKAINTYLTHLRWPPPPIHANNIINLSMMTLTIASSTSCIIHSSKKVKPALTLSPLFMLIVSWIASSTSCIIHSSRTSTTFSTAALALAPPPLFMLVVSWIA